MAQNSISSELNDLLITHDFDVDALSTKTGKPAVNERGVPDSSEADMFSFDWVGPTGKNYGTMVILLDQNGGMTVYFGDNLGRTMEPEDKKAWYGDSETGSSGFLEQLKNFAIRTSKVRGGFGLENLSKLKYAIAGQAALTESFYGTKKVSYSGDPTQARLMIKHTRPITEGDKRYRYVESLFIETAEGERFRLPFRKLAGGRAMLEHVRQGGNPYDMRGQHIAETVNQLNVLSQFRRAHQGRVFEGAAGDLVTETDQYYQRLNHNLKHMASSRGYNRYFESWKPADITEGDIMVEDLRGMFVETRIDPRIETALPMLAKIQQEVKAMKEADIFESWAANLVEGTWALPDTPEKMTQLKAWLAQPQPLGPDAENVTDVLYSLIGDDALFDQLAAMAQEDPDADAVPIVQAWITRNKDQSPELSELATSFQTAAPTAPPAPAAPEAAPAAAAPPAGPAVPAPVAENLNAFRRLAGMSESLVDQSSDETMDDPDQDDKIANFQKIGQPMNAVVGSQRTTTDTGNGNPDFQERIASVTGPDGQGMYKVTVINNDDISSSYLTKNPPRNPQFFGKGVDEGDNLQTFEDIIRLSGAPIQENVMTDHTKHTLHHILHTFKRDIRDFIDNGDLSDHLFDALYDYYHDDMPYGVAKARSGDPYEWISDRLYQDLGDHGMLDEAGVQARKIRSPNMVQTQAVPSSDISSWKFNDEPLPHTDLASSPMPLGPDMTSGEPWADEVAHDGKWIPRIHMSGVGKTHDDDETLDECNYTALNEYCPKHGLKECWLEEMTQSILESGAKLIREADWSTVKPPKQTNVSAANPMAQDPAQRAQAELDATQNGPAAASPMSQDPAQRAQAAVRPVTPAKAAGSTTPTQEKGSTMPLTPTTPADSGDQLDRLKKLAGQTKPEPATQNLYKGLGDVPQSDQPMQNLYKGLNGNPAAAAPAAPAAPSFRTPGEAHAGQGGYDYNDDPDQSDAETARLGRYNAPVEPKGQAHAGQGGYDYNDDADAETKGQAHAGQGGYDYNDADQSDDEDQSGAETARLGRAGTPNTPNDRKMNDANWLGELARIKSLAQIR